MPLRHPPSPVIADLCIASASHPVPGHRPLPLSPAPPPVRWAIGGLTTHAKMVYIASWADFQDAAEVLCAKSPVQVRPSAEPQRGTLMILFSAYSHLPSGLFYPCRADALLRQMARMRGQARPQDHRQHHCACPALSADPISLAQPLGKPLSSSPRSLTVPQIQNLALPLPQPFRGAQPRAHAKDGEPSPTRRTGNRTISCACCCDSCTAGDADGR